MPLVEQELLTLPQHLSSPPIFSGVRVTRFLSLYVCLSIVVCPFVFFSLGHCVVCSSSIYGFWLPLWYLQTLLPNKNKICIVVTEVTISLLPSSSVHFHLGWVLLLRTKLPREIFWWTDNLLQVHVSLHLEEVQYSFCLWYLIKSQTNSIVFSV